MHFFKLVPDESLRHDSDFQYLENDFRHPLEFCVQRGFFTKKYDHRSTTF